MEAALKLLERSWALVVCMALTLAVTWIATAASAPLGRAAITMLINLVIVLGLYTFIGNSGVFSFGHTAFMAVGAYATAVTTMTKDAKLILAPGLPGWLDSIQVAPMVGILIGGVTAAAFAFAVGIPVVRMSPLAASLATFALLAIVFNVAQNLQSIGGSSGLASVPVTVDTGVALLWGLGVMVAAFLYDQTRSCLRLRASRDDEVAARSVGVRVGLDRHRSFVISAFMVGLGGGIFAEYLGSFTPNAFFLDAAFVTIVMLVVGGMTTLSGAVTGVLAISALRELLREIEAGTNLGPLHIAARPGLASVALALILILVMIKRPLGLVGGREFAWPFRRRIEHVHEDEAQAIGVGEPAAGGR